jgi:threonine synthase
VTPPLQTWVQVCADCQRSYHVTDARTQCDSCNGLLDVVRVAPLPSAGELAARFAARAVVAAGSAASGVWRYAELLPDVSPEQRVSYPEGNTPLVKSRGVSQWTGVDALWMKHEGMNPTGSFKDRGMTVGVTQGLRIGARAVACASTGNTSASLAAYAALAGIPALVFVPSGHVAMGKLSQTLAYGARTFLVRGDFDECLALLRSASERLGVYLLNSINPFRIEGQKTIVFELLQQMGWNPPDWLALPAGNLGNAAAFGKALRECVSAGLIGRVPRLLAVQAEGAAPFARSFAEGFARRQTVRAETVATAIRIGDPASYSRAVRAIRETDGVVLSVSDDEILEAKAVVDAAGLGCEPASAASVAGVRRALAKGLVRPSDTIVSVLTGHVLKDPGVVSWYHEEKDPRPPRANRPAEIEATRAGVEGALARATDPPDD